MSNRSLGHPSTPDDAVKLQRRAATNWTRAIVATDRNSEKYDHHPTPGRQGQLSRAMRAERHWMSEYRRLGGALPVRKK